MTLDIARDSLSRGDDALAQVQGGLHEARDVDEGALVHKRIKGPFAVTGARADRSANRGGKGRAVETH
jgi:hypothetical protein